MNNDNSEVEKFLKSNKVSKIKEKASEAKELLTETGSKISEYTKEKGEIIAHVMSKSSRNVAWIIIFILFFFVFML